MDRWREEAGEIDARTVAMALQTAAHAERVHRDSQSVELAWTGPDAGAVPFRRTEQAILQVLDAARSRITLVSFAVYRIPNVARALVRAAGRGVRLTIVLETPDRIEGQGEYSTIRALGREVAGCSTVYYWPREHRPVGENGKAGILHVKCAVADGEWLFLSSANLTQQAFTINMELGMLITGGLLPGRVEAHFDAMIGCGDPGTPRIGAIIPGGSMTRKECRLPQAGEGWRDVCRREVPDLAAPTLPTRVHRPQGWETATERAGLEPQVGAAVRTEAPVTRLRPCR